MYLASTTPKTRKKTFFFIDARQFCTFDVFTWLSSINQAVSIEISANKHEKISVSSRESRAVDPYEYSYLHNTLLCYFAAFFSYG